MKNIRVYAMRVEELDSEIDYGTDFSEVPDKDIIESAEESGMIWTLKGFEKAFNEGDCSDQWIIRILQIP